MVGCTCVLAGMRSHPAHTPAHAPAAAQVVEARVDHSRVVDIMRRAGQLPLVKDYLLSVQKNNLLAVSGRRSEAGQRAGRAGGCGQLSSRTSGRAGRQLERSGCLLGALASVPAAGILPS